MGNTGMGGCSHRCFLLARELGYDMGRIRSASYREWLFKGSGGMFFQLPCQEQASCGVKLVPMGLPGKLTKRGA